MSSHSCNWHFSGIFLWFIKVAHSTKYRDRNCLCKVDFLFKIKSFTLNITTLLLQTFSWSFFLFLGTYHYDSTGRKAAKVIISKCQIWGKNELLLFYNICKYDWPTILSHASFQWNTIFHFHYYDSFYTRLLKINNVWCTLEKGSKMSSLFWTQKDTVLCHERFRKDQHWLYCTFWGLSSPEPNGVLIL